MLFFRIMNFEEVIFLPSEKVLNRKKKQVQDLSSEFKETLVGILVDYKGIDVSRDTSLRKELREAGVSYRVLKNNIIKRALEMAGINGLDDFLTGTTAVATSKSSYSDAARILCDFAKSNDFYKIKAGFVEGEKVDESSIKSLAKLPSKEQLIANVLRGFNTPIVNFACVLNNLNRSLVIVLSEISKKKNNGGI